LSSSFLALSHIATSKSLEKRSQVTANDRATASGWDVKRGEINPELF